MTPSDVAPDRPLVVICGLRGRVFQVVVDSVREQWPDYALHLDEPHPLRTYADFMRTVWAGIGTLLIVEADSIPPPNSIPEMLACPEPWCSVESWVGERYLPNTLAQAKFSLEFQRQHPGLADKALAKEWFRTQKWDRGLGMTPPEKYLGVVPVEESVLRVWPELEARAQAREFESGTTIHPKAIDMALDVEFRRLKIPPHLHRPPAEHLRYERPPGQEPRPPAYEQLWSGPSGGPEIPG